MCTKIIKKNNSKRFLRLQTLDFLLYYNIFAKL